jgi:hypothetical protein
VYNKSVLKITGLGGKLAVVVHASNPSTWEAEAGGSQVRGQPELHSETLFRGKKIMGGSNQNDPHWGRVRVKAWISSCGKDTELVSGTSNSFPVKVMKTNSWGMVAASM